jgi:transcriptional regulator with XRE-family HTH domain
LQFYKYIKSCREHNHITQEELVSGLYNYDEEAFESLDTVTLSRWERNSTKPQFSKQVSIIKYFQKQTNEALPCWDNYSVEEVENLICTVGIQNVLGRTKQLILNFPSKMMHVDEMKVYPIRDIEKVKTLFELNMDLHMATNHEYTQVDIEQFKKWAVHPSNLFLACEYKNAFVGLFFSIRVKEEIFDKLLNFEMKKNDIKEEDFALDDEVGNDFLLSFYALNQKVAMMLFVRHYAYLIANQKNIREIGVTTALDEVKKSVVNMNLGLYKSKVTQNSVNIEAYRQTLNKVLASEYVIKMIFSE